MGREQTIILLKEDERHYYIKVSKRIVRWGLSTLLAALVAGHKRTVCVNSANGNLYGIGVK